MAKVGRNDPCPCGSGKKYKSCHQLIEERESKNRGLLVAILLVVFLIIGAIGIYLNSRPANRAPGPAPAGKVWSEEHGHWHDI